MNYHIKAILGIVLMSSIWYGNGFFELITWLDKENAKLNVSFIRCLKLATLC